jgi:hypothetical protein
MVLAIERYEKFLSETAAQPDAEQIVHLRPSA